MAYEACEWYSLTNISGVISYNEPSILSTPWKGKR
jgi:hypothetical protein